MNRAPVIKRRLAPLQTQGTGTARQSGGLRGRSSRAPGSPGKNFGSRGRSAHSGALLVRQAGKTSLTPARDKGTGPPRWPRLFPPPQAAPRKGGEAPRQPEGCGDTGHGRTEPGIPPSPHGWRGCGASPGRRPCHSAHSRVKSPSARRKRSSCTTSATSAHSASSHSSNSQLIAAARARFGGRKTDLAGAHRTQRGRQPQGRRAARLRPASGGGGRLVGGRSRSAQFRTALTPPLQPRRLGAAPWAERRMLGIAPRSARSPEPRNCCARSACVCA